MNFNVRIGPIEGGFKGLDVIIYHVDPLSGKSIPPSEEALKMKGDIEYHLKEYYQAELRKVAGYVKWKIQRLKDETTGEPYYATTAIFLNIEDENYRAFGRKVFSRCHSMLPFVKTKQHQAGIGHQMRRKQKFQQSIGWNNVSVDEWAKELSRMGRKRKGHWR